MGSDLILQTMPKWSVAYLRFAERSNRFAVFLILMGGAALLLPGCGSSSSSDSGGDRDAGTAKEETDGGPSGETLPDVPAVFADITSDRGLSAELKLGKLDDYFFPDIMCGGAGFLDFNQDGLLDIVTVGAGSRRKLESVVAGENLNGINRLFEQQPDGRFVDVTVASGIGDENYGMGVAIGDVNNDGFPDVYFSNYGPDRLYLNQRDGTFQDVTVASEIDNPHWSASVVFLDANRDGWLDIFVTNYVDYHPTNQCFKPGEIPEYCSPSVFNPVPDRLFLNQGGAEGAGSATENVPVPRFEDVSLASGIAAKKGPGLGVLIGDWNGDGWQDIYVANDGAANHLWVNGQDGTFADQAVFRGCAFDNNGRAQAGMGVAAGDTQGSGRQDLLVTHLDQETNALYIVDEGGIFAESATEQGIGAISKPQTGFGAALVDLDLDRDLDLIVVNGRVTGRAGTDEFAFWDRYREGNQVLLNDGAGRFELRESANESFANRNEVSRALCLGDIDNDGRPDLLITNADGPLRLYRNELEGEGHWLGLRVVDPELGGRDAYGAIVRLTTESGSMMRVVGPGSSYCSSHDPRLCFGLGDDAKITSLEVTWPNGDVESFSATEIDRYQTLRRGEGNVLASPE